jgi:hypothetical protein
MITQIAILVMLLYAVGVGFLSRILHKHLPPLNQKYVARWLRPWLALFWMWGPTFWFIPGLVWFRVLNMPQEMRLILIGLSFFLPLFIFVIFISTLGLFPYRNENPFDMLVTYLTVGFVGFLTIIFLGILFMSPGLTIWQCIFYSVIVSLHPCISVLMFAFTAPHIIPCPSPNPLRRIKNSLKLITSFFTSFPKSVWMVQDGKIETRVSGNPFYGSGPGWLLTEPENIAILGNGFNLTRIEEPGVVLTIDSESPYRIIDLRNQKRSMNVTAVTRDGIEVNVPLSFSFRIDSGPRRPRQRNPWPIHRRDVYQAVFAEVVDPDGKTPLDTHLTHPWEDLPLKIATYKLKQAIGFYSLLQLYEDSTTPEMRVIHQRAATALEVNLPENIGHKLTRTIIGELVLESVRQMLKPHGFFIYAGGVENSIVPFSKELTRQRVEAWKTRWISKVMHWQAEVQANSIEAITQTDGGTALDFIDALIDETYHITQSDAVAFSKEALANSLVSKLLDLARIPEVASLLPDSVVPTLVRLQADGKDL